MIAHHKVVVEIEQLTKADTRFFPQQYKVTLNVNDHLTWCNVLSLGISQKGLVVLLRCQQRDCNDVPA